MNRNIVARIVVGMFLAIMVLLLSGCASHYSKGDGPLFESYMAIGKGSMTHQWGNNNPFIRGNGPAELVAKHEPIDPKPEVTVSKVNAPNREARD